VALVKERVLLGFFVVIDAEIMHELVVLVSNEIHRFAGASKPSCYLSHRAGGFGVNLVLTHATLEEWGF
jgi:hypothetical protein